ncbi:MAG: HAMP domain-containing sensor histidine kinase [Wenzhouxiangellaceae bacterium]
MNQSAFQLTDEEFARRALNYLNIFRLIVATGLMLVAFSPLIAQDMVRERLELARAATTIDFGAALFLGMAWARGQITAQSLTSKSLATDLIVVTLLLFAFGGLDSGLGLLLIFTAAIGGLILSSRNALFFAALATLAMVGVMLLHEAMGEGASGDTIKAGLYGLATFFTTAGCIFIARWNRQHRQLAHRRGVDLASMEQVNELIISRLRSGVVVVDHQFQIRQVNRLGSELLSLAPGEGGDLREIAPRLVTRLTEWQSNRKNDHTGLLLGKSQTPVEPSFVTFPTRRGGGTLIFLEDTAVVSRRARDIAQSSLARISASIAHEIRNPLAAISHSAQLLKESPALPTEEKRLLAIIEGHCDRMNDIVENVLQLSRREQAQPELLDLVDWLEDLASEFLRTKTLDPERLVMLVPDGELLILADPTQLYQAVWNLAENALNHASRPEKPAIITLRVTPLKDGSRVALDIMDNGPGIPAEARMRIYEPFFTTNKQGSGLGLYLAQKLCEANQASLEYLEQPGYGACFRITLRRAAIEDEEESMNETAGVA